MRIYLTLICFLFAVQIIEAQVLNDECANAIVLTEVSNWCSDAGAFSNSNATISPEASPRCFPSGQNNNDVWFTFVAIATEVNIAVIGNTRINNGGTLRDPQFALYDGNCGALNQIQCSSDAFGEDAVQSFAGPLVVGQTYFIRVSARNGNQGTFQLCMNNFNIVPEPSGDCATAVILCDKSPFTVESVNGEGVDPFEITNSGCNNNLNGCTLVESSSSWYKWTCKDAGSLTFNLTPLNPNDDLDFILYELPNGLNDCGTKQEIRCMASGEVVGQPVSVWQPCTGATGLRQGESDGGESCGCDPGDNNYVAAVNMVPGRSYALVINNFTSSGSGFSIDFGGTGTFEGPTADFINNEPDNILCVGQAVTFTDASFFAGGIIDWQWAFGAGAAISNADTEGPHAISYNTPGLKSIVLSVTSDQGCLITTVKTILVECCGDHFSVNATTSNLTCPETPNGAIDLSANSSFGPFTYNWSSGESSEDITGLAPGDYEITLSDVSTCDTVFNFTIISPPAFTFDTLITMPTCGGGTDGELTLEVGGGTPDYEFNWQSSGFSTNNNLSNISRGNYNVVVRDANGCTVPMSILVNELDLILDPSVDAVNPPLCTDDANGSIAVSVVNGFGPFMYDWKDGRGFVDESSLSGLRAGIYNVEVTDQNLCTGIFVFDMQDPPPLVTDISTTDASCNGIDDGFAVSMTSGGVGGYRYNWSDGQLDSTAINLRAGSYKLIITDANGCSIQENILINEPEPVLINPGEINDAICNGEASGSFSVVGNGGVQPFEFSIDGNNFQDLPLFENLPAGNYSVTIRDAQGCSSVLDVVLGEPVPLIVDAGEDKTINLGESTRIQAVSNESPVRFGWLPQDSLSCLDCPNPVADPVNTTNYIVTVTNDKNCMATDELTVFVLKNRPIYAPNAFSPNGDGLNETFTIFGGISARQIKSLRIFSRWGEMVFEGLNLPLNNQAFGWDGKFRGRMMNPGVFVYYAEIEFIDDEVVVIEGDLTLMR